VPNAMAPIKWFLHRTIIKSGITIDSMMAFLINLMEPPFSKRTFVRSWAYTIKLFTPIILDTIL
jgi:hypothetical protein